MRKKMATVLAAVLCLLLAALPAGCSDQAAEALGRDIGDAAAEAVTSLPEGDADAPADEADWAPEYGGYYYDVKNVVLYLETYDELPPQLHHQK